MNLDLRIADFGFAERITKNNHEESKEKKVNNDIIYGTPSYIPPEALKGKGYNLKSDVFAVGSIIFNLITHKHLFPGDSELEVLRANKYGDLTHVPYYIYKTGLSISYSK